MIQLDSTSSSDIPPTPMPTPTLTALPTHIPLSILETIDFEDDPLGYQYLTYGLTEKAFCRVSPNPSQANNNTTIKAQYIASSGENSVPKFSVTLLSGTKLDVKNRYQSRLQGRAAVLRDQPSVRVAPCD